MTIKEVLIQDWEEFYTDGVLSKKIYDQIKKRLRFK